MLGCWSSKPQMTVFVKDFNKEDDTFPKLDFRTSKIHNSENVRFGIFRIRIIDCVKNLIGKMTLSQSHVLGVCARAQHGTQHPAQHRAPTPACQHGPSMPAWTPAPSTEPGMRAWNPACQHAIHREIAEIFRGRNQCRETRTP